MKNKKQNFEKIKSNKKKSKSALFTFRRYKKKEGNKKAMHPKLIVGESDANFDFMGLTSEEKKGKKSKRKNILLHKNPDLNAKKDKNGETEKSYLRRKVETDYKAMFYDSEVKDYKLSSEDRKMIEHYLKQKKK